MFRQFRKPTAGPTRATSRPRPSAPPSFTISAANKRRLILIAVLAVVLIALFTTAQFWMRWWWFNSMGYRGVLLRRAALQIAAFLVVALLGFAIVGGSSAIAFRRTRQDSRRSLIARVADRLLFWIVLAASVGTGVGLAFWTANRWEIFALWWNGRSLDVEDPVFHRDASFYLFALPALDLVWKVAFAATLVGFVVTAVVYLIRLGLNLRNVGSLPVTAFRHLLAMVGVLLLLGAGWFYLSNFHLVYSTRGAAYGVSYTDDNAIRIANWVAIVALLTAGTACIVSKRIPRRREAFLAATVVLFLSIGIQGLLPLLVKQAIVDPDELNKERPYIANNMAMTRYAYGLDAVQVGDLSGSGVIVPADIEANPELLSNVRLWDYRVARTTYQELTSYAPYYEYLDVDIDRYLVDGVEQPVLISAREMNQDGLPGNAKTWTNRRLVYTHGYGAVVSPVDEATQSGLPVFAVSQIPPNGTGVFSISHPEIYFGEANLGWVIVDTKVEEFSALPEVEQPTSLTADEIEGGIRLDDTLTKLISSIALKDRNVFISGNITDQSTLLLYRNIEDRITEIAPFLTLDPDPYLVIADGQLVWVVDAFTTSSKFPMSTPQDGINYIRGSVKITIDARTGQTTFYRTAVVDPIADAYARMFPTLFEPIAEAPASISSHFRYPEPIYDIQSRVYGAIHVNDPDQYYNGEDRWAIPGSLVSEELLEERSDRDEMPGYYINVPLPGETRATFTLVRPFVPGGASTRKNMTAWMAGRSGPDGSLTLSVYRFPRQTNVFGPAQVEARIDQDPAISQQISLWNQSGSQVLQGNLVIIPVNETILYVQPLYLRSTSGSSIPELRRVIVATEQSVFMAETLEQAIAGALAGRDTAVTPDAGPTDGSSGGNVAGDIPTLVAQANDAYARGQEALARGDWVAYGQAQADLAAILAQLEALAGPPAPLPAGTPAATPGA
jgi:uncharacterized membrane protein (UPF0182 family)